MSMHQQLESWHTGILATERIFPKDIQRLESFGMWHGSHVNTLTSAEEAGALNGPGGLKDLAQRRFQLLKMVGRKNII